jgi:plastocyanin
MTTDVKPFLLGLALLVATAAVVWPTDGLASSGTAVGVGEREYSIAPYRTTVPPGIVRFNVRNFGEDGHNLTVLGPDGKVVAASPEIKSLKQFALSVRLKRPGTYRLVCTIAGHKALGMRSKIRVRR